MAIDLQFLERIAEFAHRRRRGTVDEHLVRLRLGRSEIVHQRHASIEEVAAAGAQLATYPVVRYSLPFQTRDEFARDGVEMADDVGKRAARWLFHREHLHQPIANDQVVAV